jgi:hypothetical protein
MDEIVDNSLTIGKITNTMVPIKMITKSMAARTICKKRKPTKT